jgi:hypothetical protein
MEEGNLNNPDNLNNLNNPDNQNNQNNLNNLNNPDNQNNLNNLNNTNNQYNLNNQYNPAKPIKRDWKDEIDSDSGEKTPPTPSRQPQSKEIKGEYAEAIEEGPDLVVINYDQTNNIYFFPDTNKSDGQVKRIVAVSEIQDKYTVSDVRSPEYEAGKQLYNCVVDTILHIFSKNSTKWTDSDFSELLQHVCKQCYQNEKLTNIVLGKPLQPATNVFPKGFATSIPPDRTASIQVLCKSGILNFLKFKYGKYSEDGSQEKIYFGNSTMRKKFDLFVKGFIKFLDVATTSGNKLERNRSIKGSEYKQPDANISIDQILMELLDLSFDVANGYDMMISSELYEQSHDPTASSEIQTFETCKTGIKSKLVGDEILSYSEKFKQNEADAKTMKKKINGYDLLHDLTLMITGLNAYANCQTRGGTISQESCRNSQTQAIKDFCTKAGIRLPGYLYDPVRLTSREGYLVFFKILLANNGGVINLTSGEGLRKDCYDESGRDLTATMLGKYYDKLNEEEKDMFTTDCETYTNKQCSKEVATGYLKQFAENAKSNDPIIARKMKNTVIKNAVSLLDGCQKDKSDINDNEEANCDIEVDDYIYKVASIKKGNKSYHFITVLKITGAEEAAGGGGGGAAGGGAGGGAGISPEAYFCFKGSITIDMLKIMSSQVCGIQGSVGNLRNAKGTNTSSLFMDIDGDFFTVSGIRKPPDYDTNIEMMRKYLSSSPQYFKKELSDIDRELLWYFVKTICDLIWVCYIIGVITTIDDLVRRGILVKWLAGKFELKNADGSFKSNNCPDCFRSVENGWSYQEGIRGIDKDSQSKYILEQVTGAAILINELAKIGVITEEIRVMLLAYISPYLPPTIDINALSSNRVRNSLAFTYRGFDVLTGKLKIDTKYDSSTYLLLKSENLLINTKIQWYLDEIRKIENVYGFYTLPKIDDIYRSPVAVIIETNSNVNFIEEISAEFANLQPKWFIVDNKNYSKLADNLNEDTITFALIVDVGDGGKIQKRIEDLKKNGENIRFIDALPEHKDGANEKKTTNYKYIFTSQKTTELLSHISECISIPSAQQQMIEAQKKNMFITTMEGIKSDSTKYQMNDVTLEKIDTIFYEIQKLMKITDVDIEENNILSAANDENTCDECFDECDIDLGVGQPMESSNSAGGGGAGGGFQGLGLISSASNFGQKRGGLPTGGARLKNKTKKHYKKRHNTRKNKMNQRRNTMNNTKRKQSYKSKHSSRRKYK